MAAGVRDGRAGSALPRPHRLAVLARFVSLSVITIVLASCSASQPTSMSTAPTTDSTATVPTTAVDEPATEATPDPRTTPRITRVEDQQAVQHETFTLVIQLEFDGLEPDSPLATVQPGQSTVATRIGAAPCAEAESQVLDFSLTQTSDFEFDGSTPTNRIELCLQDLRSQQLAWSIRFLRSGVRSLTVEARSADGGPVLFTDVVRVTVRAAPDPGSLTLATAAAGPSQALPVAPDGGGGVPLAPFIVAFAGTSLTGGVLWSRRQRRSQDGSQVVSTGTTVNALSLPTSSSGQVFLSYARADVEFVDRFENDLQQAGFDTWRDIDDISAGEEWRREISDALERVAAVVVLVSQRSVQSDAVAREVAIADELGKPILPVLITDGTTVTGSLRYTLASRQVIDVRGDRYQQGMAALLQALQTRTTHPDPPGSSDTGS